MTDEECYQLRYAEEHTIKEIARLAEKSEKSVRTALRRHHRRVAPGTPLPRVRFGRVLKGRQRAAKAYRLLDRGTSFEDTLATTGYSSKSELSKAITRHCKSTGVPRAARGHGEHVVQRKKGRSTLVISRKAIRSTTWRPGDQIRWWIDGNAILLVQLRKDRFPSIYKDENCPNAEMYHLRFREEKSWREIGSILGVSPTEARVCAKAFADEKGFPWIVASRKPGATEGVVRVVAIKKADGFEITLMAPIAALGWNPGDVITWRFEKPDRLRFSRRTP